MQPLRATSRRVFEFCFKLVTIKLLYAYVSYITICYSIGEVLTNKLNLSDIKIAGPWMPWQEPHPHAYIAHVKISRNLVDYTCT